MTLNIKIGRRVPRSFKTRAVEKIKGLIGFQENLWLMISMNTAKKKFNNKALVNKGKIDTFVIDKHKENEDMFFNIEWLKITIQGDEVGELDEYNEAMNMYSDLKNVVSKKPKIAENNILKKAFKTKVLKQDELINAYDKGYGSNKDKNISDILLEMGIITHIELVNDYKDRSPSYDF